MIHINGFGRVINEPKEYLHDGYKRIYFTVQTNNHTEGDFTYVTVNAWNKQGEIIMKEVRKGDLIGFTGKAYKPKTYFSESAKEHRVDVSISLSDYVHVRDIGENIAETSSLVQSAQNLGAEVVDVAPDKKKGVAFQGNRL